MSRFHYLVTVTTDTEAQAHTVMAERLGYDEQYVDDSGAEFDYRVEYDDRAQALFEALEAQDIRGVMMGSEDARLAWNEAMERDAEDDGTGPTAWSDEIWDAIRNSRGWRKGLFGDYIMESVWGVVHETCMDVARTLDLSPDLEQEP